MKKAVDSQTLTGTNMQDGLNCSKGQRQIGETAAQNSSDAGIKWKGPEEGRQQGEWKKEYVTKRTIRAWRKGALRSALCLSWGGSGKHFLVFFDLGQMLTNQIEQHYY